MASQPTPMVEKASPSEILRKTAPRRGLSRDEAAGYIGVGHTKFDEMVADGRMPKPRIIDARKVWDLIELDTKFSQLPHDGDDESKPVNKLDKLR